MLTHHKNTQSKKKSDTCFPACPKGKISGVEKCILGNKHRLCQNKSHSRLSHSFRRIINPGEKRREKKHKNRYCETDKNAGYNHLIVDLSRSFHISEAKRLPDYDRHGFSHRRKHNAE